jgi:hypothetical protein
MPVLAAFAAGKRPSRVLSAEVLFVDEQDQSKLQTLPQLEIYTR